MKITQGDRQKGLRDRLVIFLILLILDGSLGLKAYDGLVADRGEKALYAIARLYYSTNLRLSICVGGGGLGTECRGRSMMWA